MTKYAIQTLFAHGWDYVGSEDGQRVTYDSKEEAQDELDDLFSSAREQNMTGYNRKNWRVAEYHAPSDTKDDL